MAKKDAEKTVTKTNAAKSEKIRIRLKAYDHVVLEQSAEKIDRSKSFRTYSTSNRKGSCNSYTFSTQTQRFKRTIRIKNS